MITKCIFCFFENMMKRLAIEYCSLLSNARHGEAWCRRGGHGGARGLNPKP